MTTPELPPLPEMESCATRLDENGYEAWSVDARIMAHEARERILLARIAELEASLTGCVDLAEWWINHKREPRMNERDYMTWLSLGHRSDSLLKAKAAIATARGDNP